ncbi:MAG TPA: hypothetical protein VMY34_06100 [Acidimicrobiales bacterium]|nr:hypothetical protein [Acidimicrobiales bacterium]
MKRIALLIASMAAVGALSMTAAQADDAVVSTAGGCGLHLEDHGSGPGFYSVDADGNYSSCDPLAG